MTEPFDEEPREGAEAEDLTWAERVDLRSFPVEPPPPDLEGQLVAVLRAEGLIRGRSAARVRWMWGAAAVALLAVVFAGGIAVGILVDRPKPSDPAPPPVASSADADRMFQ